LPSRSIFGEVKISFFAENP
jgi:hypothetical protein